MTGANECRLAGNGAAMDTAGGAGSGPLPSLSVALADSSPNGLGRRVRREERRGWKQPRQAHEAPHPTFIEPDRYRVLCRECGWYWTRLGVTPYGLREMGKHHRTNMQEGAG